jgi:hypothetical protein
MSQVLCGEVHRFVSKKGLVGMVRIVLGAAVMAIAVAAGTSASKADGAITSLGDLDGGAAQFGYIDPTAGAGTPSDAITTVRGVPATSSGRQQAISDHLSVELPLPPLHKPVAGKLWFARDGAN